MARNAKQWIFYLNLNFDMDSIKKEIIRFRWDRGEFFEEKQLHDLYHDFGPLGPQLILEIEELSHLTDKFLEADMDQDDYVDRIIDLAERLVEILKKEPDSERAWDAASLIGYTISSFMGRRFVHYPFRPARNLVAEFNYALHQFGVAMGLFFDKRVDGLQRLQITADRKLKDLSYRITHNHPKILQIRDPFVSNDLAYSKTPNLDKGRFQLKKRKISDLAFSDAYNRLVKKHIGKETSLELFKQIFGSGKFEAKVAWDGSMVSLKYFVDMLIQKGIVECPKDKFSTTINCFFVKKLKVETNDAAILSLRKAAKPKDKSQLEIDLAIADLA